MTPSALIQAWRSAARDLGIEIIVPFSLTLPSGVTLEADLLVKDFGAPRGMMVSGAEEDVFWPHEGEIVDQGYGYSIVCDEDLAYDRDYFIKILDDWGWSGPETRSPPWMTRSP